MTRTVLKWYTRKGYILYLTFSENPAFYFGKGGVTEIGAVKILLVQKGGGAQWAKSGGEAV